MIKLKQRETPYTILPRAVFSIKDHSLFRVLVLLAYFYSMAMTEESYVEYTYRELRKLLELKDPHTKKGNGTVSKLIKLLEENGIIVEKETSPSSKATLVNVLDFPDIFDKEVPEGFFRFPKLILLLPVSVKARALLIYLFSKIRKTGKPVKISRSTIVKELHISKNDVAGLLRELEENGLIEIKKNAGKSHLYVLKEVKEWPKEILELIYILNSNHPFVRGSMDVEEEDRADPKIVNEVKETLKELKQHKYQLSRKPAPENLYRPLYDILGKDAETLLKMYFRLEELLPRNYSTIRNPLGFLLSIFWKDRGADFDELLKKFCLATGIHIPEIRNDRRNIQIKREA